MERNKMIKNSFFNGYRIHASYDNRTLFYALWLQNGKQKFCCPLVDVHGLRLWLDNLDDQLLHKNNNLLEIENKL
jgi:hypothetical protein